MPHFLEVIKFLLSKIYSLFSLATITGYLGTGLITDGKVGICWSTVVMMAGGGSSENYFVK